MGYTTNNYGEWRDHVNSLDDSIHEEPYPGEGRDSDPEADCDCPDCKPSVDKVMFDNVREVSQYQSRLNEADAELYSVISGLRRLGMSESMNEALLQMRERVYRTASMWLEQKTINLCNEYNASKEK